MGLLIEGNWQTDWYDTMSTGGKFVRKDAQFKNWITEDGTAGPAGRVGFKAEPNRYHLYVSLARPWAHRTLIFRELKGLTETISVSVVNSFMGDEGWTFEPGSAVIPDSVNGKSRMHEIYTLADPNYTGRVTVPVLWDKHERAIVSNESADIIRMFNSAFENVGATSENYYPTTLHDEIDSINERIYHGLNNGVYRAGFATRQNAYDEAVSEVFNTLEYMEDRLSTHRYLTGSKLTEADWRAFTTLVRFDAVYVGHFKCNRKRIVDYPALSNYLRELYQIPGIAETVDIDYIKAHYYTSHETINPTRIVPIGPALNLDDKHDRHSLVFAET